MFIGDNLTMYDNAVAIKIAEEYKKAPLTDFASVNRNTRLDTLNLNWRERDLPERFAGPVIPHHQLLERGRRTGRHFLPCDGDDPLGRRDDG